jgi:coenzyme F420-reducing hydrogenase delta subunit
MAILACARSALGGAVAREPRARLLELPCTARVSTPLLLSLLCAGTGSLLVLGRHAPTCRFGPAEPSARVEVDRTRQLLGLLGLEPERVAFAEPASGDAGPTQAFADFVARSKGLPPLPRPAAPPAPTGREDFDAALAALRWLAVAPHATARHADALRGWLHLQGLPVTDAPGLRLDIGELAWLEVLFGDRLGGVRPLELARMALDVLHAAGQAQAGIGVGGPGASAPGLLSLDARAGHEVARPASSFDAWLRQQAARLPRPLRPARVATDGSAEANATVIALGHEPVEVGVDPLPAELSFSQADRRSAQTRLARAAELGAVALLLPDPRAWLRTALLVRPGAWRSSRVAPTLAVQLAWAAQRGRPVTRPALESAPRTIRSQQVPA